MTPKTPQAGLAPHAAPPVRVVGGRYGVGELIARGEWTSVWSAHVIGVDELLAIKFLDTQLASNPSASARFFHTARVMAGLRGENTARVLDVGSTESGVPYVVMVRADGETLEKRLDRTRLLALPEVVEIVCGVANALGALHAMGLVHRDVTPRDVFLQRASSAGAREPQQGARGGTERALLLGFGLAASPAEASRAGKPLVGNPYFLAPERTVVMPVDARADLWSLGVVAFIAATGAPPFDATNLGELFALIAHGPIPVPSQLAPHLPPAFDAWFARACARDAAQRFASAAELAGALRAISPPLAPGEPCPTCREPTEARMVFCSNCGRRLDHARRASSAPPPRAPSPPPPSEDIPPPSEVTAPAPPPVPSDPTLASAPARVPAPPARPSAPAPPARPSAPAPAPPARPSAPAPRAPPARASAPAPRATQDDAAAWLFRARLGTSGGELRAAGFSPSGVVALAVSANGVMLSRGQAWEEMKLALKVDVTRVRAVRAVGPDAFFLLGAGGLVARVTVDGGCELWGLEPHAGAPVAASEITFYDALPEGDGAVLVGERLGAQGTVGIVARASNRAVRVVVPGAPTARLRALARVAGGRLFAVGAGTLVALERDHVVGTAQLTPGELFGVSPHDDGALVVGAGAYAFNVDRLLKSQIEEVHTTADLVSLTTAGAVGWAGSSRGARILRRSAQNVWIRLTGNLGTEAGVLALAATDNEVRAVLDDATFVIGTLGT